MADEELLRFEYWAGNPSIRILEGVLHCWPSVAACRSNPNPTIPSLDRTSHSSIAVPVLTPSGAASSSAVPRKNSILSIKSLESDDSETNTRSSVLVLASSVPHSMPPAEFAKFLLRNESECPVRHAMVLRGVATDAYMVLLAVDDMDEAMHFVNTFHERRYNEREPHTCKMHVVVPVPVPVLPSPRRMSIGDIELAQPGGMALAAALEQGTSAFNCTVCLENIDNPHLKKPLITPSASSKKVVNEGSEEFGGFCLTILCGHSFHWKCLTKWCDDSCPICRFQQHPFQASTCDVCQNDHNLRICLTCGFIGCCDPPQSLPNEENADAGLAHSQYHFESTSHAYALDVNTQRVYDYAGQGFVHQLLGHPQMDEKRKSETEDFPTPLPDGITRTTSDARSKKLESTVSEFNHILSTHLAEQRSFYEERYEQERREQEHATADLRSIREREVTKLRAAEKQVAELRSAIEALAKEQREALAQEEKYKKQEAMLESLNKKISAEQQNEIDDISTQIKAADERKNNAAKAIAEVKAQMQDVRAHLRMQARGQAAGISADGGYIVVTEQNQASAKKGHRRKKR